MKVLVVINDYFSFVQYELQFFEIPDENLRLYTIELINLLHCLHSRLLLGLVLYVLLEKVLLSRFSLLFGCSRTLAHYLAQCDKPLEEKKILEIFYQIVQAIKYIHQHNILHRSDNQQFSSLVEFSY
jgi:serine/threonine protein kinase